LTSRRLDQGSMLLPLLLLFHLDLFQAEPAEDVHLHVYLPPESNQGKEPNTGKVEAAKEKDCRVDCPRTLLPVCGSDKNTYDNKCLLEKAACESGKPIIVVHQGKCRCSEDGPPDLCVRVPDPRLVCGSDGEEYANECFLEREACESGKPITVVNVGKCEDECKSPWVRLSTGCYMFKDRPMNWYRARRYCKGLDAKLVEIDSSEENRAIIDAINARGYHRQKKQFWLGLTDRRREGQWVYESTLKEPRFKNWAFRQPDNGGWFGKEDCAYMKTDTKWNDWNCRKSRGFFFWTLNALCEKSIELVDGTESF